MKKTEYILLGFALVSIVINFMLIPGGGILILLSLGTLSMFYMFFSFLLFSELSLRGLSDKASMGKLSIGKTIGSVLSGIVLSFSVIGLLFYIQRYPGATIFLYMGWAGLFIAVSVAAIKYTQTKATFYKRFLLRAISFFLIVFLIILLPKGTIFKIMYRNHPDYVRAHEELMEDPNNKELQEKAGEERKKAHGIE